MLFNSLAFLVFFPIVLLVYFVLPLKVKQYWLLAASYYFYMCWNVKYALLILVSTAVTYLSGLLIEKIMLGCRASRQTKLKKLIVVGSFSINLGILFYFKYMNFAIGILARMLSAMHISIHMPAFDVMLPVGISFYTFQALSYTVDIYRGDIYAEKNFFQYALFVSFFPQLVAGPIERSGNLLKQLAVPKKFHFEKARDGFLLMIWGYFLKIVVADRIAIFVDTIYGDYHTYNGLYIAAATVLFAVQIYCDFSGYSIIAMGAAEILGIDLMENFNAPYLSVSVAEFWRNWHISLTSWFKDYLYIPLGGSRKGRISKYCNKMIVFLVSGLWHGADLSFIVWGGINGVYQVVGEMMQPLADKLVKCLRLNRETIGHKMAQGAVTFILIDFSWIFFRADSYYAALELVKAMFGCKNPWIFMDGSLYTCGLDSKNFWLMMISVFVLLFADIMKKRGIIIRHVIAQQDYWCRCLTVIFAICFILVFGVWGSGYDIAGFIYFQF